LHLVGFIIRIVGRSCRYQRSVFPLSYFSKQSMSLLMYREVICFWSVPLAISVGSHNIKYSPFNSLTTRALSETQGTLRLSMNIGFTSVDTSALRTRAIDLTKIHFNPYPANVENMVSS
jgi:hypothetical protein